MAAIKATFARVKAWVGRPLGRAGLVLAGLVVLSLVGRFAAAGGHASPVVAGVPSSAPSALPALPPPATIAEPAPVAVSVVDASAPAVQHSRSATEDDPVYLNDATLEDLRRLPGVGEKRGLAILELRHKLGHFRQIEDLMRVKGMGRASMRRLRPLIRIDHATDGGAP
jgi:competence protein ComEA